MVGFEYHLWFIIPDLSVACQVTFYWATYRSIISQWLHYREYTWCLAERHKLLLISNSKYTKRKMHAPSLVSSCQRHLTDDEVLLRVSDKCLAVISSQVCGSPLKDHFSSVCNAEHVSVRHVQGSDINPLVMGEYLDSWQGAVRGKFWSIGHPSDQMVRYALLNLSSSCTSDNSCASQG